MLITSLAKVLHCFVSELWVFILEHWVDLAFVCKEQFLLLKDILRIDVFQSLFILFDFLFLSGWNILILTDLLLNALTGLLFLFRFLALLLLYFFPLDFFKLRISWSLLFLCIFLLGILVPLFLIFVFFEFIFSFLLGLFLFAWINFIFTICLLIVRSMFTNFSNLFMIFLFLFGICCSAETTPSVWEVSISFTIRLQCI